MRFEIEDGSGLAVVDIQAEAGGHRDGGRFNVTIRRRGEPGSDEAAQTVLVDARRTDTGLSLIFPLEGRSVDAAVTPGGNGTTVVQLAHVDVPVVVDGRRSARGRTTLSETGEQRVVAPMPGRILKVLVAPGDDVRAGQAVVVIEAMKMENDLKVARDGRVREVLVSESVSVEAGKLLVVVE
jgi:biotin carboxyl carrier protein